MAGKVKTVLKMDLPAGRATAAYPVGPTLGPYGVNIGAFVRQYNERTATQVGTTVPVRMTIYEDRSFDFILRLPPVADLLRKAAGIEKGSAAAGKKIVGTITRAQLREITRQKMPELNAQELCSAERTIEGTARSMGIEIVP